MVEEEGDSLQLATRLIAQDKYHQTAPNQLPTQSYNTTMNNDQQHSRERQRV